jgi:amino acid permease
MNDPQRRSDINIVLGAALLLFGFIWLIAYATGGTDVIAQTIRPYLPSWFPIVNL